MGIEWMPWWQTGQDIVEPPPVAGGQQLEQGAFLASPAPLLAGGQAWRLPGTPPLATGPRPSRGLADRFRQPRRSIGSRPPRTGLVLPPLGRSIRLLSVRLVRRAGVEIHHLSSLSLALSNTPEACHHLLGAGYGRAVSHGPPGYPRAS